jgi:8-oxo-dGTP pyrophosphatase MutT (NUDIX family)
MKAINSMLNTFGGVVVDTPDLPVDPVAFKKRLQFSLESWKNNGHKLVWLEIPIDRSDLIPQAVSEGFFFHHAESRRVMLVCRLQPGAFVPHYATHYVGAGGVVLKSNKELLVVSERHRRHSRHQPCVTPSASAPPPSYKLPGGALRPGEHIADAVIREVREETGISTEFESLICFRHWHGYRFGKSDIYFVCRLLPLDTSIRMQEEEIAECMWMPVQDYLESENVHAFNKKIVAAALDCQGIGPHLIEGYGTPETHEFFFPLDSF